MRGNQLLFKGIGSFKVVAVQSLQMLSQLIHPNRLKMQVDYLISLKKVKCF
jgi:hypothetical protein